MKPAPMMSVVVGTLSSPPEPVKKVARSKPSHSAAPREDVAREAPVTTKAQARPKQNPQTSSRVWAATLIVATVWQSIAAKKT